MSTIAELERESHTADHEFARLNSLAMSAEDAFEGGKRSASPSEFSKLHASMLQSKTRADDAHVIAAEKSALLTAAREAQGKRQRAATAQRAYDDKLAEFNACHATLFAQQKQFGELRDALTFGGQLHTRLLQELETLKRAAESAAA